MRLLRFILIITCFSFFFRANGQADKILTPLGLRQNIYTAIPKVVMPYIDSSRIDIKARQQGQLRLKTPFVAYDFKTDFTPANSGVWKNYIKDIDSWVIKLHSRNAYGMSLVFSKLKLMPGEKVFVYNLQGIGASIDQSNVPATGVLPLNFVKGDEIVIEYDVPTGNTLRGAFIIESVSHAYEDVFADPGVCNVDVQCAEGVYWQNEKRAVVRLAVHSEGGTRLCTGTLLNNTSGDGRPYILTAQHCVVDQYEAERTVATFNHETIACGQQQGLASLDLEGASYVASLYEHDFSLIELNNHPPVAFRPYYAGWDISDQYLNYVACIHHPEGSTKKISVFKGTVVPRDFNDGTPRAKNGFWNITKWDDGVTEGGSSGAPLFNRDHKVMGTLTGGSSECGSPYNDYFERLSQSWEPSQNPNEQLKQWLDPLSTGAESLDGLDLFGDIIPECDTLSNIPSEEIPGLAPYTPGTGYFSGFNSDSIASYAEKFFVADSMKLTGAILEVGSLNADSPGGIIVTVYADDNGLPGSAVYESYIPYSKLSSTSSNYVEFYPYAEVKNIFFIGYTMSYSPEDSFALKQGSWGDPADNTAFMKVNSGWVPMSDLAPGKAGSSLAIQAIVCDPVPVPETDQNISFYPNPSSSVLVVNIPANETGFQLQVVDMQGKEHHVAYLVSDQHVTVDLKGLNTGMYIVRMMTAQKIYQAKFIKSAF